MFGKLLANAICQHLSHFDCFTRFMHINYGAKLVQVRGNLASVKNLCTFLRRKLNALFAKICALRGF